MCIEYSKEKHELSKEARNNLKAGIGYKMFRTNSKGNLFGICRNYNYKQNRWMTDTKKDQLLFEENWNSEDTYKTGYHIYLTNVRDWSARDWCGRVHKVKYKNVTAIGNQDDHPVVVAREMIIKEEVK